MSHLLPIFPSVLGASGLQLALDQPFFPGKVILWLLFMLSLMSWAVITSKLMSLRKFRRGDRSFTDQLRRSKRPLEIHEKGWSESMSLRQEVYNFGAGEAAFQLLGTTRHQQQTAFSTEKLSDGQMMGLREALGRGLKAAESRLNIGMSVLQATAAGAPFLGLLGMVWIMMGSFGETATSQEISKGLSSGLGVMAIGLLAATPAIFGQIFLRASFRNYLRELGDFKLELHRLFERSLSRVWNPEDQKTPASAEEMVSDISTLEEAPNEKPSAEVAVEEERPAASPTVSHARPKSRPTKVRVFKSVRQDQPMINPIAMKARQASQG